MLSLLNWRIWLAIALVSALAVSHTIAYKKGAAHVSLEWKASIAQANDDARRLEQQRQRRADEAAKLGAARQTRIAVDSGRVRGELSGLRESLQSAERAAQESRAAADQYRATCSKLLIESGELLAEVARAADAHSSDVRMLLDAWPR